MEEFEKITEARIDVKTIASMMKVTPPERDLQRVVANYYFYLRRILTSNPHDSIYRENLRRLEELRRQWIMRKIDLKTFFEQLKALDEWKRSYDHRITGKSLEDKVCEAISVYIASEVFEESRSELKAR